MLLFLFHSSLDVFFYFFCGQLIGPFYISKELFVGLLHTLKICFQLFDEFQFDFFLLLFANQKKKKYFEKIIKDKRFELLNNLKIYLFNK